MAKKKDDSIPVVQSTNTGGKTENRQVQYVVVDGKVVPDTHPGVVV